MYTYRYSTEPSTTVSLRCPECHVKRSISPATLRGRTPTITELCCPDHVKAYREKVRALEKEAWRVLRGRKRLPTKVAQRVKTSGVLSNLAEKYLGNK